MKRWPSCFLILSIVAVTLGGCTALGCRKATPWIKAHHIIASDAGLVTQIFIEAGGYFTYGGGSYWRCGRLEASQMARLRRALPSEETLQKLAHEKRDFDGLYHLYLDFGPLSIKFLQDSTPSELRPFLELLDKFLKDSLGDEYVIDLRGAEGTTN